MPLRVLITAGPTREHLDPIRFFSNGSSGKMGFALAEAAAARGCEVNLVSGPVSLANLSGVAVHRVVSAEQMLVACEPIFPGCDVFIAVAAVADYRPEKSLSSKIKKTGEPVTLRLVPTVDVLRTLAARKSGTQIVVGFAAETHDFETYARRKLIEKHCDFIVANDVSQVGVGMDADDNAVVLLGRDGGRGTFGPASKRVVAQWILDHVLPK